MWRAPVDESFIGAVMVGGSGDRHMPPGTMFRAWDDPVAWAMDILGLEAEEEARISRHAVQRRFRILLRDAHPDHGGVDTGAADRIAELTEARRILLAS